MDDHFGNSRQMKPGSYLGAAPQSSGFGRKVGPSLSPSLDSTSYSSLAQQVADEYRAAQTGEHGKPPPTHIEFVIGGSDIQYVEFELEPGQAVIAENGSMNWKDYDVEFSLVLGDGRNDDAGIGSKLLNAGANMISGESPYLSQFRNNVSNEKLRVALGGSFPGAIVPVKLEEARGALICHRKTFLACTKGIEVSASIQPDILNGLLGQEGLITQTLFGNGWAFLHVGGTLIEHDIPAGKVIQIDSGCVVAHEASVRLTVGFAGGFRTMVAGQEGLLLASLSGPGKVWIQSLPFERTAQAIVAAGNSAASSLGQVANSALSEGITLGVKHAVKEGGASLLDNLL